MPNQQAGISQKSLGREDTGCFEKIDRSHPAHQFQ
jgi:hypothetical protein